VATPQKKTRQREEHCDGEVEPAEQPARDSAGVTGLERDVSDDDANGRARAHPLDRGQETTSSAQAGVFGAPRVRTWFRHDDQCAVLIDRRENR